MATIPGSKPWSSRPQVGPDQGAASRSHEDVAYGVVLPVVDLALEDPVDDGPGLVTAHSDVQEDPRVVPVDEFRRDDPGVGAVRLFDQQVHAIGVQRDVVVAQQEERRTLDHAEGLVGGRGVPGPTGQVPDECVRQCSGDAAP